MATWRWLHGTEWRWIVGLSFILAVQLLGGHFQIAFFTHVVTLLLGAVAVLTAREGRAGVLRRSCFLPIAMVGSLALAAAQLVPTAELLVQADMRGRDYGFLASFATPPLYLINYLAPTLLHQHPFWEPLAWIPSRTSPRECLTYVGLVPLGLALWALRCIRRESKVRVWCLLLLVSIALSFGPYMPGFRWLVALPGMSWFSASARWSIVSSLFLGLLAGHGLQRFDPEHFRRSCRRYACGALIALTLGVIAIVVGARGTDQFDRPPDRTMVRKLQNYGHQYSDVSMTAITPASELSHMLLSELSLPGINLGLLLAVSFVPALVSNPKRRMCLVLLWSVVDLSVISGVLRPVQFDVNRPLVERSPVLADVADSAPHRVAGTMGNLAMAVGTATFGNLDVPDMDRYWRVKRIAQMWPESFATVPAPMRWGNMGTSLSNTPIGTDEFEFFRLSGFRWLLCHYASAPPSPQIPMRMMRTFSDPWLSMQVLGQGMDLYGPAGLQWTLWESLPDFKTSRAWTFPVSGPPEPGCDPRMHRRPPPARRHMLDVASAAELVTDEGEQVQVSGTTDSAAVLVLSDMDFPGWDAVITQNGSSHEAPIDPAFGGWRAVLIPEAGQYVVTFSYDPASFRTGCQISLAAILLWVAFFVTSIWLDRGTSGQSFDRMTVIPD